MDVFFKSSSLSLVSEACLFMPGGAGFSVFRLSKLLSLMTSHLLAWKREFDLSENGDLLFPFLFCGSGPPTSGGFWWLWAEAGQNLVNRLGWLCLFCIRYLHTAAGGPRM